MTARERAYVEWLAQRRGIATEEAMTLATQPRPRPFEPAKPPTIERRDNVVQFRPRVGGPPFYSPDAA